MRSAEINRGLPGYPFVRIHLQSRKLPLLYYPELVLVETADSYLPAYMFYPGIVPGKNNIVETSISGNVADGYLAVSWIDISIKRTLPKGELILIQIASLNGQLSCSQVNNFRFNAVYSGKIGVINSYTQITNSNAVGEQNGLDFRAGQFKLDKYVFIDNPAAQVGT